MKIMKIIITNEIMKIIKIIITNEIMKIIKIIITIEIMKIIKIIIIFETEISKEISKSNKNHSPHGIFLEFLVEKWM